MTLSYEIHSRGRATPKLPLIQCFERFEGISIHPIKESQWYMWPKIESTGKQFPQNILYSVQTVET